MFKQALKEMVDGTEGGVAGLIMDMAGIALDSYTKDGSTFDINTVGAEYSVVLGQIRRASENLDSGSTREVSVGSEKVVTVMRMLNDTYFLAMAMNADGNLGKGRFLMRVSAPKITKEL